MGENIDLNISLEKSVSILRENGFVASRPNARDAEDAGLRENRLKYPQDIFYWITPKEISDLIPPWTRLEDFAGKIPEYYPTQLGSPVPVCCLHRDGSLTFTYGEKSEVIRDYHQRIKKIIS